jgi:transposase
MKPLYTRDLTEAERQALQEGLRSSSVHTVRRSQIILMSAEEKRKVDDIGQRVGRSGQQVRRVLHAFNREGIEGLKEKKRGRQDDQRALDDAAREQLREIIRRSPRDFGYETSLWTLDVLADECYRQGLTDHRVHKDTISATLMQLGIPWKRAKKHIQSPDEHYQGKKTAAIG